MALIFRGAPIFFFCSEVLRLNYCVFFEFCTAILRLTKKKLALIFKKGTGNAFYSTVCASSKKE